MNIQNQDENLLIQHSNIVNSNGVGAKAAKKHNNTELEQIFKKLSAEKQAYLSRLLEASSTSSAIKTQGDVSKTNTSPLKKP